MVAMEIKKKKCKVCRSEFTPYRTTDRVCSVQCASGAKKVQENARKQRETAREDTDRKQLFELAKITFNGFIRQRDKKEPCISCGNPKAVKQAGHYYSGGGHAAVIFDEDNVNGQCVECNMTKAGNVVEYGVKLENKIGKDMFELLRARAYEAKHWTKEELRGIIKEYKQKTRDLSN